MLINPLKLSGIEIPFLVDGSIDTEALQKRVNDVFQYGSRWAKIRVACDPASAWQYLLMYPKPRNVLLLFRVLFDNTRIAYKILTVDLN